MNISEEIQSIIINYLAGEASSDEVKLLDEWLAFSVDNRKIFNELKDTWLVTEFEQENSGFNVDAAIERFKKHISNFKKPKASIIRYFRIVRYAAVFLLIVLLPISYYFGFRSNELAENFTTITAPHGDVTTVVLPDSSEVVLNSKSEITFSNNFQKEIREVELVGEAYFSVTKDPVHPFVVKTKEMSVRVLGTEFNLRAYANEDVVTTTLVSGSLKVNGKKQSVVIKPNQKVILSKVNHQLNVYTVENVEDEIEWKSNWLVFNNQTLEELSPRLERWFNISIVFEDEAVKNRRFTGALKKDQVLEAFTYFGNSSFVECKIRDREIVFASQK